MAEEGRTAKTKSLGSIPFSKLEKLEGWKEYLAKAVAYSKAKSENEVAKIEFRANLTHQLTAKNPEINLSVGYIDFNVDTDKKEINVFQRLEDKEARKRELTV
jgi:hypothetical protein